MRSLTSILRIIIFSVLLSSWSIFATEKCDITSEQKKILMKMDYVAFDQSPPSGGWREYSGRGCEREIIQLLETYAEENKKKLKPEEMATIKFHTGQFYANLGETAKALPHMKAALNETLDKKWHWNLFIEGTIAFLEKNLEKLKITREKVIAREKDHPYVATLGRLIKCFARAYKEIGDDCNDAPDLTNRDLLRDSEFQSYEGGGSR